MSFRVWLLVFVFICAGCEGDSARRARDAVPERSSEDAAAESGAADGGASRDPGVAEGGATRAPEAGKGGEAAAPQAGDGSPAAGSSGGSAVADSGASLPVGTDSGTAPAACQGRPLPVNDSRKTLMHAGVLREYVVHVPPSYDGQKSVPLVVDIHGYTYTEADQEAVSGWRTKSDAEGFIVVYPKGLDASWNGGSVCCGASQEEGVDDEGFVRALVKQLSQDACIDDKRVYATGLSNGGALSFLLACRAADVFAATAPVSIGNGTKPCEPVRPISVIMYRGTSDNLVPYDGGVDYPSASADLTQWRTLNACPGAATKLNGVCDQYTGCKSGTEVMLCTIPRGTHILYSDATKAGASVADVAWDMFKRHALP